MTVLTFQDKLPFVRGQYRFDVPLAPITWFQVGGPADAVFRPQDAEDLACFLKNKPADLKYIPLGVGSNLLVRDGGIRGVVIRFGKGFTNVAYHEGFLDVGAGVLDKTVATIAAEEGFEGLEFFSGIPGTIGGALRMNAGCYGTEIKDILEVAFVFDPKGTLHRLTVEDLGYQYRHCALPDDWIFVGARFKTRLGNRKIIQQRIQELLQQREETQPIHNRTGGSTFANPEGHKAWKLIDQAGCRGLKKGDAEVSQKHCNFLINTGKATAADLEELGEVVRQKVFATTQIQLRWEIQRIGEYFTKDCRKAA